MKLRQAHWRGVSFDTGSGGSHAGQQLRISSPTYYCQAASKLCPLSADCGGAPGWQRQGGEASDLRIWVGGEFRHRRAELLGCAPS